MKDNSCHVFDILMVSLHVYARFTVGARRYTHMYEKEIYTIDNLAPDISFGSL